MRCTAACLESVAPIARSVARKPRGIPGRSTKFTQITSEVLCDDALQLLKPSLPPPRTCDIIDLNPGRCIWSQELHALLQPRRHILIEPKRDAFAGFIDPLLNAPDTHYRYASSMGMALDREQGLLSEDIYDFQENLKETGAQQYAINERLLMTANLSGIARKAIGFTGSEAKQTLNDYYRSIFVRENFLHRYGLIRLLAWVGEDSRKSIIPTTVSNRTKQSIQLETACTIEEVVGPSQFEVRVPGEHRWYPLSIENQKKVRDAQQELGLEIPPQRAQPDPSPPFRSLKPTMEVVRKNQDLYPHYHVFIKRLIELDDHVTANDPTLHERYQAEIDNQFEGVVRAGKRQGNPPLEKAFRLFMTQLRTNHNTYLKTSDFLWEQRELFLKIQKAYKLGWFSPDTALPIEGPHESDAEQLIQDDQFMQEQRKGIKQDTRQLIHKSGDDYRCYDFDNQCLAWNRRRYEPLLVDAAEFSPHKPLTLIDFRPDPNIPLVLDTVDKQVCFDYICTALMIAPSETVLQAIKRLIPAGHEMFIERVPELRNVTMGGWWNLQHVRTRSLHHDLFIAIALAYHDWPHRRPIGSLMSIYKGAYEEGPK